MKWGVRGSIPELTFMQYFKYFIYFTLSLSGFLSRAELQRVLANPIAYTADVVPRNTNVGEDESRKINLTKWISLSDEAVLGLTPEGQVFGVVSLDKVNEETQQRVRKNYAYLLSGERTISEIFLDDKDTFWAIDNQGQILVFDRTEWLKTPLKKTAQKISKGLGDDLVILTIIYLASKYMIFTNWDLGVMPTAILSGLAAVGFGISQFLRGAITYEKINRNTDAFVSSGRFIDIGPNIVDEFSQIVEKIRLEEGQSHNRELFDRTCELRLLPLPVDHSTWKP